VDTGGLLIVDDNPTIVGLLGGVLRDAGYDVRAATDGARALSLVASRPPELILLDLRMPGMDGLEVCRRFKSDPRTSAIPIVVISASDELDEKVRAFEAGAADYVVKPFEAREVLARVGAHVQLYRLRRELEQKQAALEASQRELAEQNRELIQKNEELEQAERRTRHVFSALAAALPGTVLDGKYRLDEKIGTGGFATVFRAEHLELQLPVAVKVFRPWEGMDSPKALQRFRREGIAACRVQHPNAVSVMDFGISATGIAYLVMELLRGVTLGELLRTHQRLHLHRCVEILAPVCEALAEAHAAGLVHRDIKPDNVFLHRTPRGEIVKVLDFGIAKLVQQAESRAPTQHTRGLVGTPFYLAPERVMGLQYDGRADVYSVGVMLYAMLSGRQPFPLRDDDADLYAALMRQVMDPLPPLEVAGLPPAAEELVRRTLSKQSEERPSARELADELAKLA
jgi:DNA-binding response OmpR family regulator